MLQGRGGAAGSARACGDRHAAGHRANADRSARRQGNAGGGGHHRWPFTRAEAGGSERRTTLLPAHHRAELSRHRRARHWPSRQFRAEPARPRQARLSVAIGCARHRHPRLGRRPQHRLLLCGVDGRHGRCRRRRSARLSRRGHRHRRDPALSRDHPGGAQIHVGGEVGGARQAGDRDQVRPKYRVGTRRGHPYRRAGRQRRGGRRGVQARRAGAGGRAGRAVRRRRNLDLAQAGRRQRAVDRDQWRRRRRARGRRSDALRRATRARAGKHNRQARRGAARQLVTRQSDRHHRRRPGQTLRGHARRGAGRLQSRRHSGDQLPDRPRLFERRRTGGDRRRRASAAARAPPADPDQLARRRGSSRRTTQISRGLDPDL